MAKMWCAMAVWHNQNRGSPRKNFVKIAESWERGGVILYQPQRLICDTTALRSFTLLALRREL